MTNTVRDTLAENFPPFLFMRDHCPRSLAFAISLSLCEHVAIFQIRAITTNSLGIVRESVITFRVISRAVEIAYCWFY